MLKVLNLAAAALLGMGVTSVPRSTKGIVLAAADDAAAGKSVQRATLQPASAPSPDIPFKYVDSGAERTLLELANQSRLEAGLSPLTPDPGLTNAARVHAEVMFQARRLSHQFDGELPLPQRLAASTQIQLDQEGENVAFDSTAVAGHAHLMLSPPHRANLLNAGYNVVGFGVVRGEGRLYIVEDFGHALPVYSIDEMKTNVAATVVQMRRHFKRSRLLRRDLSAADDAACSMARADQLATASISQLAQRYIVLSYTSLDPQTLPDSAGQVLSNRNLRDFSIGACYARTATYPTGVYWMVLSLE